MASNDASVTDVQRRLLIAEARKWLRATEPDPANGVGHEGLPDGDRGLGGHEAEGHAGVGRAGGGASPPTGAEVTELAERILAILGERG